MSELDDTQLWQKLLIWGFYTVGMFMGAYNYLGSDDPAKYKPGSLGGPRLMMSVLYSLLMVSMFAFKGRTHAKRARKESATNSLPEGFTNWGDKRDKGVAKTFCKNVLFFFFGFYVNMSFALTWFPAMKKSIAENRSEGLVGDVMQSVMEVLLVMFFFTFLYPLWVRIQCRVWYIKLAELWHPEGKLDAKAADGIMLSTNFFFDVIRFVYGRGVLFALSSPIVFFAILIKDLVYHLWHFGAKYCEVLDWILRVVEVLGGGF